MPEHPRKTLEIGLTATTQEEVTEVGVQIAKVVLPRFPTSWHTFALTRHIQDELGIRDKEVAEHFLINFRLIVTRDQISLERTTPLGQWKEIFAVPNEKKIVFLTKCFGY
jgi:hypothetical protein